MRKSSAPGSARAYINEYRSRISAQQAPMHDPFAINPIRRSFLGAAISLAVITIPFLISSDVGAVVMLSIGWLAMATIVFCVPILIWSIGEALLRLVTARVHPPVSELDLPDRIIHILQRHGVQTIHAAQLLDPASLHLMSNMEDRDVNLVIRAINLWHYRRWQDAGFPAEGGD